MAQHHYRNVTDEERREFLKVLGVTGAVAAGGVGLSEIRKGMESPTAEAATEHTAVGQAIRSEMAGEIDTSLVANQQSALTGAASALPTVIENGVPSLFSESPRTEFLPVAEAGRPIYDHLLEVGFFETTTQYLPDFTPDYLSRIVSDFVGTEALAKPLTASGLSGEAGTDLVASVIANAKELQEHHWIASDKIAREEFEIGSTIPTVTQGTAGGALLWLEDLDLHLWQKSVLINEPILKDAVWHGQGIAAGFNLMSEAARTIGDESSRVTDRELGALLSTGFAVQAISQTQLPQDVYWITEPMRKPRAEKFGVAQ